MFYFTIYNNLIAEIPHDHYITIYLLLHNMSILLCSMFMLQYNISMLNTTCLCYKTTYQCSIQNVYFIRLHVYAMVQKVRYNTHSLF